METWLSMKQILVYFEIVSMQRTLTGTNVDESFIFNIDEGESGYPPSKLTFYTCHTFTNITLIPFASESGTVTTDIFYCSCHRLTKDLQTSSNTCRKLLSTNFDKEN